jgi:hypothetical protein
LTVTNIEHRSRSDVDQFEAGISNSSCPWLPLLAFALLMQVKTALEPVLAKLQINERLEQSVCRQIMVN